MQDPDNRIKLVPTLGQPGQPAAPPPPGHSHGKRMFEDEVVDLAWVAPKVKLLEVNDQLGGVDGALCYWYV